MAGNVKVNGVWKSAANYYIKVNGVWKTVTNGYVKVNGVWKSFQSPTVNPYYAPYFAPYYAPYYGGGGGGCTYYTVPNVSGLNVSQATNSISGSGNIVGSASSTSTIDSGLDGIVYSQSPSSGLYCGQQTVSFSYYTFTAGGGGGGNPCGTCGSGGTTSNTEFYCQGNQRWSRSRTDYFDSCGAICNTTYGAGFQEVSCSPACGCGVYYAPYYAPAPYYEPTTAYSSPYYAYWAPPYYAPVYSGGYFAGTFYATPYYSPTSYFAPVYSGGYFAGTFYATPYYAPYYASGGGCWAYGTEVTMSDGTTKFIEDLVAGDTLLAPVIPTYPNGEDSTAWYPAEAWSLSEKPNLTTEPTTVTNVKHVIEPNCFVFNGRFKLTANHFVFVKKSDVWQFAKAEELEVGDFFQDAYGNSIEISSKEFKQEQTMVVDIDVEQNDLFLANGIITHNFKL